jgi:hypothetical protein
MSRLVTLTGPAWYWLGNVVIGSAGVCRWVLQEEPDNQAYQQQLHHAKHAEAGYARLRPDTPTLLSDAEHAGLTAILNWNLAVTQMVREHPMHPDLLEPVLTRLIALDAARDQLAEAGPVQAVTCGGAGT